MHQTRNLLDGYMGSGKLIKAAIAKYGKDNFEKEILFVFDNEDDMRHKEKELVVLTEMSYNLCDGGKGGFGYLNKSGKALRTGAVLSDDTKKKISASKAGKPLSEEHKRNISANNPMQNNPEARRKMSDALRGRKLSEEHKQNIAKAIRNKNAGMM